MCSLKSIIVICNIMCIEWSEKYQTNGIQIKPSSCGSRIVMQLYWDEAPLACENFATLCTNGNNTLQQPLLDHNVSHTSNKAKLKPSPIGQCGKPLSYKNSMIHRIEPNFIMQGGDFVFGNGSGGESIYNGKKFKDEKGGLQLKHDGRGIVSMGNSGKNSNTSQFFITFDQAPQCNGKHVVFGKVISGLDVLDAIEDIGNDSSIGGDEPRVPIQITDCGAFYPLRTPGSGYWFDQPDVDSFTGYTPVFITRPRTAIISPTMAAFDKFAKVIGDDASCLSLSLDNETKPYTEEDIADYVMDQLSSFAIDIVIVAPVYAKLFQSFTIPSSWQELGRSYKPEINEVILISKPIDALKVIKDSAWIGKI